MTYLSVHSTAQPVHHLPSWETGKIRKVALNLFAVVAIMASAAFVASAYHSTDGSTPNLRLQSMGVKGVPTSFRGAPPA